MPNSIIDAIVAVGAVMLVWYMVRAYLRATQKNSQSESNAIDDYLKKMTHVTGISAYDTFCISAEEWRVSADRIAQDFRIYLSSQTVPYYVKDFIRKSQKQIDVLYVGSGGYAIPTKRTVFFSFLVLLFWGGVVFLCLYVFPIILPEDLANIHRAGPP